MDLRYGTNPHQAARIEPVTPGRWPIRILNGSPSYINLLDALNSWQLVHEASTALGRTVAASFKHVSPAGVATSGAIDGVIAELYGVDATHVAAAPDSVTAAYVRARDADPKCSYGDFAAVSEPVDAELADVLAKVVCDGIIAPGFETGVVERLKRKQGGRFLVIEADAAFEPSEWEQRDVHGLRMTQQRDGGAIAASVLDTTIGGELTPAARADLLLGLVVLRYTQSNSVCYVRDGVTLGIGAGQQSRVDCTRLAGGKVDTWWLRRHPAVRRLRFAPTVRRQDRINWQIRYLEGDLTPSESQRFAAALVEPAPEFAAAERRNWLDRLDRVSFISDGLLPFRDNVDHAHRHGVAYIAEPGGSIRSAEVEDACREHGIVLARTGLRLFHH